MIYIYRDNGYVDVDKPILTIKAISERSLRSLKETDGSEPRQCHEIVRSIYLPLSLWSIMLA